ncbi:permease [Canibacter zhoujuaniae]|uniref:permease n=1 Tax=Canibacter zhoujuaniae TaxID=2708343 RepID=UPI00141F4A89|nr:permease [Canibacter zhoujuaniae]
MRDTTKAPHNLLRSGAIGVALTIICVLILRFATDRLPATAAPTVLRDLGTLAAGVFIESLPFVILGALIAVAVQLWVPATMLFKLLPKNAVLRRAALSILGVVLPVCECGNVPLARGLLRKGLSPAETLTFVLAAPILNPVTIITTYQAFGFGDGILIARIMGGFLIANLIGWVFSHHSNQQLILEPDFAVSCASHDHAHEHSSDAAKLPWKSQWQRASASFTSELLLLMPALALGSLLAGAIQTGIPTDFLATLGAHPIYSVLALTVLAFTVSICSTVDAFFMLAFASIFLPGGIVAFLIFGAMIDIKMLLLLRTTFTTRTLAAVTALALLGALAIGFGVNLFV